MDSYTEANLFAFVLFFNIFEADKGNEIKFADELEWLNRITQKLFAN